MTSSVRGHRQRLRERFLAGEAGAQTEDRLLELLLTFAIPQKDVRPLAESLLETFESLPAVLEAAPEELRKVGGLGEATIVLLKLIAAIPDRSVAIRAPRVCTLPFACRPDRTPESEPANSAGPSPSPAFTGDPETGASTTHGLLVETRKESAKIVGTVATRPVSLFGKGLMRETIDCLPKLPETESLEEIRAFLRQGGLHHNAEQTRARYANYIVRHMFPAGYADAALRHFARRYAGTQALRDVCFYRFLTTERLAGCFVIDALLPALGPGVVPRSAVIQYLQHRFPEANPPMLDLTATSLVEVLASSGIVKLVRGHLRFEAREICLESLAFILHSEFPVPGMYDTAELETNPAVRAMLWRPDRLVSALYELRNRSLLAKISEIDGIRQFTTRYHLDGVVQAIIDSGSAGEST